jgi:hypothetical protein
MVDPKEPLDFIEQLKLFISSTIANLTSKGAFSFHLLP